MSNTNKPFGFSPWRNGDGSPWNGQANLYFIASNDTNVYSIGDPVKSAAGSGTATQYDPNGYPTVVKATSTDTLRGIVVGVSAVNMTGTSIQGTPLSLENVYLPATKPANGAYVWVVDDPNVIFKCQLDNGTVPASAALATMLNKNTVITVTAGTTISAAVLATASLATTNTLNIKLLGLVPGLENQNVDLTVSTGQYAVVQCKINEHELQGATAGV